MNYLIIAKYPSGLANLGKKEIHAANRRRGIPGFPDGHWRKETYNR
jgi:hypothetical protein